MSLCSVDVGEKTISIKSRGRSKVEIVNILGKDFDSQGNVNRIYLDSFIHSRDEFEGWNASGAISTILQR